MSTLTLPRPDNLRGRFGQMVESDVYMIADRVREIDPSLFIYATDQPGVAKKYAICEHCVDGVERLVFATDELDARVLTHLQYLLRVPFEHRFAEAERIADQNEAERKQNETDEFYERLGRPMWTRLEHDGFIETRGVSFPKAGATGGKGSLRRQRSRA